MPCPLHSLLELEGHTQRLLGLGNLPQLLVRPAFLGPKRGARGHVLHGLRVRIGRILVSPSPHQRKALNNRNGSNKPAPGILVQISASHSLHDKPP